jgi:hypothetical protein
MEAGKLCNRNELVITLAALRLQLLHEKGVDKQRLKDRAAALDKMGEIFTEAGRTHRETSDPGADTQKKRQMAQDRVEKAMHDTLEKMDRAEQEAAAGGSGRASPGQRSGAASPRAGAASAGVAVGAASAASASAT